MVMLMVEMIIITIYYSKIHGEMTNAALYCIATVSLHLQIIPTHKPYLYLNYIFYVFIRVSLKLTLKPRIFDGVVENWCLWGDTWRWDGVRGQVLDDGMTKLHSAWLRTPNINIYIQYLVFSQSLLINIFYLYRYLFIIYTWRLGWEAINLKR